LEDYYKHNPHEILKKDERKVIIRYNNLVSANEEIEKYEMDVLFREILEENFSFNYIGSFRLPPERTYYRKPNASKVGVNGEGYIDQIIKWEESDKKKYDELIEAVTEMGLFRTIQANKMKGGRFELNVQVNENSELASLTDVGFGISQFLPIIVADLQMNKASCLAISQPEIHLHPKIQATLGDYFCKQVNNTDKQYIVETHSEYLINRMRLLIVKGELKPEDVKLYYMENDGIKTTTYAIELTTDGQIKNAPQGFFDTYEMDVMDIALYASA
jgi:predicted ATPase